MEEVAEEVKEPIVKKRTFAEQIHFLMTQFLFAPFNRGFSQEEEMEL